jgi:hypothetical protein
MTVNCILIVKKLIVLYFPILQIIDIQNLSYCYLLQTRKEI